MKNNIKHSAFYQVFCLLIGILVGGYALFGQMTISWVNSDVETEKVASNDASEEATETISIQDFIGHSGHSTIDPHLYFITEFFFSSEDKKESHYIELKFVKEHFATLFRKIIPINAP